MFIKIAINGYGRIGRNILRALYQSTHSQIKIVAINDLGSPETNAHLTKYDTVHGAFSGDISVDGDYMLVNGDRIKVCAERNPAKLPWKALDVDVVLECTGLYTNADDAALHIQAGAKKVLISAPGSDLSASSSSTQKGINANVIDATIVYGVNHQTLTSGDKIISNASCTTNCLAPMAKALNDELKILNGLMVTVHAYTSDQVLEDSAHSDLRRARSATMSMIPASTGAAKAIGLVLPELAGKLDGYAIRVPTVNVSMVDFTFISGRHTSVDEVNAILKAASEGPLKNILAYNDIPLVSIDFNHNPHSCIVDSSLTKVNQGNLVKVCAWYDNEWGFSNRMLDTSLALMQAR